MLSKIRRLVTSTPDPPDNVAAYRNLSTNGTSFLPTSLQRKFARGVNYNLKIIVKGDRNVGKSALLMRLQGRAFSDEYEPTDEIKVVNINWDHKLSDDIVKLELWEAVDKAISKQTPGGPSGVSRKNFATGTGLKTSTSATFAPASALALDAVGIALDAETIDVYRGASGVLVVVDLTKKWTVEYLQREVMKIPACMPVLVVANHKDMYHHAAVTIDQVQSIINDINVTRAQQNAQGTLSYAECSMRNGYGLKLVEKFFSIPFLYLQRETLCAHLEMNARDICVTQQELTSLCEEQLHRDSYDTYLNDLTQKRRTHAEQLAPPSFPVASDEPTSPATRVSAEKSILATVPVKELMSNPRYKIEYPTIERHLNSQAQQQKHQQQPIAAPSPVAASTKSRPSIIIGRGKPIVPPATIVPGTLANNAAESKVMPISNAPESSDDDATDLAANPMVRVNGKCEGSASNDDNISVDYDHGETNVNPSATATEPRFETSVTTAAETTSKRVRRKPQQSGALLFETALLDDDDESKAQSANSQAALDALENIALRQSVSPSRENAEVDAAGLVVNKKPKKKRTKRKIAIKPKGSEQELSNELGGDDEDVPDDIYGDYEPI